MATAAGPQLTRPDVLAVVETMQIINTVLERLASREEELRLWARVRTPTKTKFSLEKDEKELTTCSGCD